MFIIIFNNNNLNNKKKRTEKCGIFTLKQGRFVGWKERKKGKRQNEKILIHEINFL